MQATKSQSRRSDYVSGRETSSRSSCCRTTRLDTAGHELEADACSWPTAGQQPLKQRRNAQSSWMVHTQLAMSSAGAPHPCNSHVSDVTNLSTHKHVTLRIWQRVATHRWWPNALGHSTPRWPGLSHSLPTMHEVIRMYRDAVR
jgi:hypothetical protein